MHQPSVVASLIPRPCLGMRPGCINFQWLNMPLTRPRHTQKICVTQWKPASNVYTGRFTALISSWFIARICTCPSSSSHPMDVILWASWNIYVQYNLHHRNIEASGERKQKYCKNHCMHVVSFLGPCPLTTCIGKATSLVAMKSGNMVTIGRGVWEPDWLQSMCVMCSLIPRLAHYEYWYVNAWEQAHTHTTLQHNAM